jgi:hypothetical protein
MRVARLWCKPCRVSIGLLPDFICSRISGTLAEFEQVATAVDEAASQWEAAEKLRPYEGAFESALKWVRFRAQTIRALLQAAVGLVPELLGCEPTLEAIADRLGLETGGVLARLRVRCEAHLESLAAPLGLVPRPFARKERKRRHPQSAGPDPPPAGE